MSKCKSCGERSEKLRSRTLSLMLEELEEAIRSEKAVKPEVCANCEETDQELFATYPVLGRRYALGPVWQCSKCIAKRREGGVLVHNNKQEGGGGDV